MKHMYYCQPKSTGSDKLDHDGIRLQNPLLSLTTDAQSPNINYNWNLYNDQYADDDYADDHSSVNYDSYISHTDDIVDTDNINNNNVQEPCIWLNKPSPNKQMPQIGSRLCFMIW
jgi:hypothetical protein